jgi:hypothetical protein
LDYFRVADHPDGIQSDASPNAVSGPRGRLVVERAVIAKNRI